jgi:hypothetical protein
VSITAGTLPCRRVVLTSMVPCLRGKVNKQSVTFVVSPATDAARYPKSVGISCVIPNWGRQRSARLAWLQAAQHRLFTAVAEGCLRAVRRPLPAGRCWSTKSLLWPHSQPCHQQFPTTGGRLPSSAKLSHHPPFPSPAMTSPGGHRRTPAPTDPRLPRPHDRWSPPRHAPSGQVCAPR